MHPTVFSPHEIVSLPQPIGTAIESAIGLRQLNSLYGQLREPTAEATFAERLLKQLEIHTLVSAEDVARIPRTGPVLVVANHPFGILDGAVLSALLPSIRRDVKILGNALLAEIPELSNLLVPVDVLSGKSAVRRNSGRIRTAVDVLTSGGMLVVFPAGEVSHFQWRKRSITDPSWHPQVAAILRVAQRRGPRVSVLPVYVNGSNSLFFQAAGIAHPRLRTLLLGRELLNKRGRTVEVRIGSALAGEKILSLPTQQERIEYLRWRTYLLASRNVFKPRIQLPMRHRKAANEQQITNAVAPERMACEIAALPPLNRLATNGDFSTYVAEAAQIPATLREIGRLREIAFRSVGEGTGRALDLDEFDAAYLQLFVWNEREREVAGAYRLAGTDRVQRLYTATLFQYSPEFLSRIGPALELGRSFVRVEYQRAFQPLLLLWKGIGAYVARNPRYRVLFGPVSISNEYQTLSRKLIVSFLERHALMQNWMAFVSCRKPFRSTEPKTGLDLDDLSALVSDLEPGKPGVPVLLRHYLKLGGKLLAFNLDPNFSEVVDGLILVDLTKTEEKLLERYLGRAEARQFLAFQKASLRPKSSRTMKGPEEYSSPVLTYTRA
jgi:putative hemolysin